LRLPIGNLCDVPTVNETRLNAYIAAEAKILGGQSVTLDGRSLVRANLAEVRNEIGRLQMLVTREQVTAAGRGGRFSQADFSQ
jgi:hypothetical protein